MLLRIVLLLLITPVIVAEPKFMDETEPRRPDFEESTPWKEDNVKIPTYPQDSDLVEFNVDAHGSTPFRYFIDTKSLTVGNVDQVVRYTIVIQSGSGARNVAFEGIRCNTAEYKTYAVGGTNSDFHSLNNSQWVAIKRSDQYRYRLDLREFYFCQTDVSYEPYELSEILYRLGSKSHNNAVELF